MPSYSVQSKEMPSFYAFENQNPFKASLRLESSRLDLLLPRLAKEARIAVLFQIGSEASVLALQLTLLVGNKEPGDQTADDGKGSSDEEDTLNTLLRIVERVLDRREDLGTNSSTSLAYSGGKAEEVATHRGGEGFGTAEESGNLWSC